MTPGRNCKFYGGVAGNFDAAGAEMAKWDVPCLYFYKIVEKT